eukprot:CAMPEP_0119357646 /NCGR_PEP_ID=MMETSP1334-20130426/5998_1 /TAXON_ID=127549 /ORGANISM="Calcidiscus leptoporus, Strain RCC1130" /LENGTH=225 /DNA_ID=CAMNT_0007371939 /DNA_START=39 /DNA_END=720 /DNA_ORIENTATION=+
MAASLATVCEEAMGKPGVVGVACVDEQGLCLSVQGDVPEAHGSIAALTTHAALLCGSDLKAVVSIMCADRKVLLSRSEGITTAIFMQPAARSTAEAAAPPRLLPMRSFGETEGVLEAGVRVRAGEAGRRAALRVMQLEYRPHEQLDGNLLPHAQVRLTCASMMGEKAAAAWGVLQDCMGMGSADNDVENGGDPILRWRYAQQIYRRTSMSSSQMAAPMQNIYDAK